MAERLADALQKVDPAQAWEPWEPSAEQPWNLKWAGHLFRRATFGTPLERIRSAVEQGLPATVDGLLTGAPDASGFYGAARSLGKQTAGADSAAQGDGGALQLQNWWLYVMVKSPHPLLEKMTLFWHNHFVSSISKVRSPVAMIEQNELLRRHALGKFRPFVQAVSDDAAMQAYLDATSNFKEKPNENYARELMELFTLGVGNYTEKDVKEAARAFTGWFNTGSGCNLKIRAHDYGPKTVLGKTGNWTPENIIRILLEQPVAARFIVRKLYHFFVSEAAEPPDTLLEPLAEQFRKSDYDIYALVRAILCSRHFFSDFAYRQRIKSPLEFVLGAVQSMTFGQWEVPTLALVGKLETMGQTLFAPPNVKGWPGGKSWLNTSTVLARHNFAQIAASGQWPANTANGSNLERSSEDAPDPKPSALPNFDAAPDPSCDAAVFIRSENCQQPEEIVNRLLDLALQGTVSSASHDHLVSFLSAGFADEASRDSRIRATVHAILTAPEYQLA
jgi:uncharacterized protein (DUF1800 family)